VIVPATLNPWQEESLNLLGIATEQSIVHRGTPLAAQG
jgi:hypothetical protein